MCVREFEVKDMYEELKEIIDKSKRIVFFGGAGVSTESGVPDFRSENGLYQARQNYGRSPEELLSYSFSQRYEHLLTTIKTISSTGM